MRFKVKLTDYLAELVNQISIFPNRNHQVVLRLSQHHGAGGKKLQSKPPQSHGSFDDPVSAIGKTVLRSLTGFTCRAS